MKFTAVGPRSNLTIQSLVDTRRRLDDMQRQLGTGQKSLTYAGLGLERSLSVGLRSRLSEMAGFAATITNVKLRVELAQASLGRVADIGREIKTAANQALTGGEPVPQQAALGAVSEMLGLLNTKAGDRYLFSGRALDRAAVANTSQMLDGDGTRAGLRQVIDERRQADLGADGLGRLILSAPNSTAVQVSEDVAGSPFGFKLGAVTSTLTGATVTGPAGSPSAVSVDLGANNPQAGETVQFRFTLPDGTTESITLTASASATPGAGEFAIGATSDATAINLQAALTAAIGKLADTSLTAASAMAAGSDFFASDPPQRVAGPPFAAATALVDGTAADTVSWYTGESGPDSARATAVATVDTSITVAYGVRANEEGIRWTLQHIAVLAAVSSGNDANAQARSAAINQRAGTALDGRDGLQSVADIQAELASAQTAMASASERHRQTEAVLADMVQQIEGVSDEEVAASILALQTSLQASLETTSIMFRLTLVNFL